MEKWQLETAERLASIERSIKYIEVHIADPPHKQAFEDLDKRITSLETFKAEVLRRIAWVSGAFSVIATTVVYAFDYVKNHLSLH